MGSADYGYDQCFSFGGLGLSSGFIFEDGLYHDTGTVSDPQMDGIAFSSGGTQSYVMPSFTSILESEVPPITPGE